MVKKLLSLTENGCHLLPMRRHVDVDGVKPLLNLSQNEVAIALRWG